MKIICRTCLIPDPQISVFSSGTTFNSAAEAIMECTSVKIHADDEFSVYICETCLANLEIAHRFRMTCIESEIKLKTQNSKINDTYFIPEIKVEIKQENIENENINPNEKAVNNIKIKDQMTRRKSFKILNKKNVKKKSENNLINKINQEKTIEKNEDNKNTRPFSCKLCLKTFKGRNGLKYHTQTHTGEGYVQCDICHRNITRLNIKRHKEYMHSGDKKRAVKVIESRYECEICGKRFKYNNILKKHMCIHTNIRNFMCEICGKTFTESGNLKQHKLIHSGIKPYKCRVCDRTFFEDNYRRKHERLVHSDVAPHECRMCEKKFKTPSSLKKHFRIHSGEKPFKCDLCDKTFASSSTRVVHRRTHTGERPHECRVCGKRFTQRSPMMIHLRKHKL